MTAAPEVMAEKRPFDAVGGLESAPRKKFKVSELPLSSSQRAAIDGLVHTIKKKGFYDTLRKQVWAQYTESVCIRKSSSPNRECADTNVT